MNCPYCYHDKSKVVETRFNDESVWRRRRCFKCEELFVTQEYTVNGKSFPTDINREHKLAAQRRRQLTSLPQPLIESGFQGWARP